MSQLSRLDIDMEIKKERLKIIPFVDSCAKAASYDITPSIIAMSVKAGMLEKVYREPHYNEDRYYILVHPKDTVLIVSNEYLVVPSDIAGYVSSRVSKLVDGFGHISTTIDPNWCGAALIALSNPSNQPLKVYVGGNKDGCGNQNQLATITFHYLNTACEKEDIDGIHMGMRLDLLEKVLYKNKSGVRAFWRKVFFQKRRKFTDYFMSVCKEKYQIINESEWKEINKEFSYINLADTDVNGEEKYKSKKARIRAKDFIITENIFTQIVYFIQRKQDLLIKIMTALLIVILVGVGIISEELLLKLMDLLNG